MSGCDLGERRHALRLDFQHVVDFALDIGEPAPGAFHAFFGAGAGFAGARQRFERNLGGAVGFRHHVLGRGQRIGGDAAGAFGGFDFADQRAALFGEQGRRVFEFGALGRDLGDAGLDGRDLRGRALPAVLPFGSFGQDRLQPAVGQFGLARQRLRFGAHLRGEAAMALDVGADGGESGFGVEARRQFGQRRGGALMRGIGLGAVGIEAGVGFGQRRFPRRMAIDFALGSGMAFARGIGLALRGAPGVACGSLGCGSGLQFGLGGFQRLTLGGGLGAGLLEFVFDIDQPGPFGQAPRRAGRRMGGGDKSVPAPDVAFQATPAAARSSIATPVRRRALWRRRRSARDAAPIRTAPRHASPAPRRPRATQDRPR